MVSFRQTMLPFNNTTPYHIMKQFFIPNDVSYLKETKYLFQDLRVLKVNEIFNFMGHY